MESFSCMCMIWRTQMPKYVFRNPQPPGDIEREIIARNLVRSLEKIGKFQIEQEWEDSWTHLKIHAPDGLVKLFKRLEDKRLKPKIKGQFVYFYIDEAVTSMDVRLLVGNLIKNKKDINKTIMQRLRQSIALRVLTIAKTIYPTNEDKNV